MIGRAKEIKILEKKYNSTESEFIDVYKICIRHLFRIV